MMKNYFLLALLAASTTSALAGTFTVSTDTESHEFYIKNPANNYYCKLNGNYIGSTQTKSERAAFKIYAGSEEGKYYLFCTTNNKYVTYTDMTGGQGKVIFTNNKGDAKQWKLKSESDQTERYDIFPEGVTGNNDDLSWNWHGGVGNNMGFYKASDGNSTWTFVELVDYTFNYNYNNQQVTNYTTKFGKDDAISVSDIPNCPITYYKPTECSTVDGTTYTVNCSPVFEFADTYNASTAHWYAIDMHNNQGNILWKAADDASISLPTISKTNTPKLDDYYKWTFVGSIAKGFKLYNKATNKALVLDGVGKLSDEGEVFQIKASNANNATTKKLGFCLTKDNTNYLNHQTDLKTWTSADEGSTMHVQDFGVYAVKYAKVIKAINDADAPEDAIGSSSYLSNADNLAAFNNAYAAATAEGATDNQKDALGDENIKINETSPTMEVGKYYRLYNKNHKKYLCLSNNAAEVTSKIISTTDSKSVASVVYICPAVVEGRYRIKINGLTFGKATQSSNIQLGDENYDSKGGYVISHAGKTFTFFDAVSNTNFSYLHAADSGTHMVGWSNDATASEWYVIPATDVEISLAQVGDSKYTSVYLPYDVKSIEGAKAYVGKLSDDQSALNMTNVESVPANNGFVLVGDADKATLTIGEATALAEGANDITGTNTGIVLTSGENDNHASYLVFGKDDANSIGFFVPATALNSIPANKAYINASALSSSALVMNFGGNVTAIDKTMVDNAANNAPVFDLTGRRVVAPVKGGIYIMNGKKFVK